MSGQLTPVQARLAASLERVGTVIVRLPVIQRLFTEARPSTSEHADRRETLREDLQLLAAADRLRLPRTSGAWDRSAAPPLPGFVAVRPALPERRPMRRVPSHEVGWRPELRWAAEVRDWSPRRLDDLLAINRFLGEADGRPTVPLRERSVSLLGDEKRLGALLTDPRLFGPDRLTLELLRARRTSPPLIARTVDPGRDDALIVENWDTFETLADHRVAVGTVLYGAGAHVTAALPSLLDAPPRALRYFGDLDAAGLTIAARASQRAAELGLPDVRPDHALYRLLLEHGRPQPIDKSHRRGRVSGSTIQLCAWLADEDLEEAAALLLDQHARLAQEQVGVELLEQIQQNGHSRG